MGGEHAHGGEGRDFRAKVWSMIGGPYCRPKHWKGNTAIAMFGVFLVCIPIAMKSAELEDHGPVLMCFKHQNTMAATMVSFSLTKDYCTLKWRLPNGFLRKQFLTETSTTAKQKLELGFRGMILLYDVLVKRKWQRRIDMMLYLFEFESRKLRLFKMEDVSMGMWVKKFNSSKPVEYMHSLKFCQFGCIEGYFTAHYQSPRQMICMWG